MSMAREEEVMVVAEVTAVKEDMEEEVTEDLAVVLVEVVILVAEVREAVGDTDFRD